MQPRPHPQQPNTAPEPLPRASGDRFARIAAGALGADGAMLFRFDGAQPVLLGRAGTAGAAAADTAFGARLESLRASAGAVVEEGGAEAAGAASAPLAWLGVRVGGGAPPLGALLVVDERPRRWTSAELRLLDELAAAVEAELGLRAQADALRVAVERYTLAQLATRDVVWDLELDGDRLHWGEGITTSFGYAPESVEPTLEWWAERLHPVDVARVRRGLEQAIAAEGSSWSDEYRFRRADGSYAVVLDRGTILRDAAGAAVRMLGSIQDVSANRAVAAAVERSEATFRSLVENASEVTTVLDVDWTIAFETSAIASVLGYSPEERAGTKIFDYAHDDDRGRLEDELRGVAAAAGEAVRFEARFVHRDGSHRWMEGVATNLLADGAVGGIVCSARDVTARVEAQRALAVYSIELERSNRELQDFAYIASHDLQEPLRKVQAFGDRLDRLYAEVLDEVGRDYLRRMRGAAGRMQALIRDLLAYSRVTTTAQAPVPVALCQVVDEVVQDLSARVEQVQGSLQVGALPTVDADPVQMRQLFQNLIANALKFHRDDVPPVVSITAADVDDVHEIRVADNGIGLEMEYADHVFRPFERLHGRSEFEGTGIGLAIVRKIVERHGGSVRAEGVPGEGATFVIRLPRTEPPARRRR